MQHKFKLATLLSLLCANAFATPIYQPPGPNLTYGSSSNNQSIMSSIANPAAAAAVLGKEDSQYRFGIINIGGGYEIGNVGQLYNTIDNSKNTITAPITPADLQTKYLAAGCTTSCTAGQSAIFINDVVTTINTSTTVNNLNVVLSQLQQDGNVSVYGDVHVPLTPFVVTRKGLGGSFVLDANVSAIANMSFIEDPLSISSAAATTITNNYATYVAGGSVGTFNNYPAITNDSTLVVKAAVVTELGLGYSRSVLTREAADPADGELKAGDLTAGVRMKYYQVRLADNAQKLITSTGAQSTLKASQTYTTSSGFGLDVGTLWTSKHYRAGAWINNLNSPSFKYNTLDLAAAGYTPGTAIYNQLAAGVTYEMKPQLQLEGAVFSESQNWVVNAGLDANAVQDPVGRDFQWMTLSASYATSSWWIPGARVGYRSNRAGSKLSYVTGGLTLFKALSLDIAYGLDSVTDNNGNSIPRSAMINLGLQMTF